MRFSLILSVFTLSSAPFLKAAVSYQWTNFAGKPAGAGNADGTGRNARFDFPGRMAINASGDIFVCDVNNYTIRKITPSGVVTTFAGKAGDDGIENGLGTAARFKKPNGLAFGQGGNLFVADEYTIRKITPTGQVSTYLGSPENSGHADGSGASVRFAYLEGIASDAGGNLYVASLGNHTIRKITPAGLVSTIAGSPGLPGSADGLGSVARFNFPSGIAVDGAGVVFVTDQQNHTIRKITTSGQVTTLAGLAGASGRVEGSSTAARFNTPFDIVAAADGNLYVADFQNGRIRKVTSTGSVTTLAGGASISPTGAYDGTGTAANFGNSSGIAQSSNGDLWMSDSGNTTVRKVTLAGVVTTIAGSANYPKFGSPDGTGEAAVFGSFNSSAIPRGIAVDSSGNTYVADTAWHIIRKITPAGVVTTLAGQQGSSGSTNGTGSAARFSSPYGVAVDSVGNVFVADSGNSTIRKVTPDGLVTTFAGSPGIAGSADGLGDAARFSGPIGITVNSTNEIYVVEQASKRVRKITSSGLVTTFKTFTSGSLSHIAAAPNGDLFINYSTSTVGSIYKLTPSADLVAVAGSAYGYQDGPVATAQFVWVTSLAVDTASNVYITDSSSSTVRKITPAGNVSTVGGTIGVYGGIDGLGTAAHFNKPLGIAVHGDGTLVLLDGGNGRVTRGVPNGFPPVLGNATASNLQASSTTISGDVNPRGLSTTALLEYGETISYGNSVSVPVSNPVSATSVPFSKMITGLSPNRLYHFRVTATNELGSSRTVDATFTTAPDTTAPVVTAPGNLSAFTTESAAVAVTYPAATATDDVGVVSVTYSHNSGTLFPLGVTTVTITARDAANNIGTSTFTVTVTNSSALGAFGNWATGSGLNGANSAPTATPFNDGVENLLKYAFNMNAAGPDVRVLSTGGSSGLPQVALDTSGAEPVLKVAFLRRKGSGLTYTPQRSDTLGDFTTMTGTQTVTSIDAQWERVSVEEPAPPATAPRAFARVQVTLP
ncbi:MAG: hypothetical protein RLZZ398_339 [Verrucomicrobiota bacterium]